MYGSSSKEHKRNSPRNLVGTSPIKDISEYVFMCLVMKMLPNQPYKEIVIEFIKNEDCKNVRVLGAFYLRLTGSDTDLYRDLELLYNDYRRLKQKIADGYFTLTHVDEVIEELLTEDFSCDIALPSINKRRGFEEEEEKEDNELPVDGFGDGSYEKEYYCGHSSMRERDRYRRRDSHRYMERDYDRDHDRERRCDRDRDRERDGKREGYYYEGRERLWL